MLSLNESTLFFFNLRASMTSSASDKQISELIKNWIADVSSKSKSSNAKPKATTSVVSSSAHTVSTSTKSWITSGNCNRVLRTNKPLSMIYTEGINEIGGLEDEDENKEHEAVISSPIKGNKWVTSMVYNLYFID